jgi:hypothetical protein
MTDQSGDIFLRGVILGAAWAYRSTRLANIGLGHGTIDAGGGYTYFPMRNCALGFALSRAPE